MVPAAGGESIDDRAAFDLRKSHPSGRHDVPLVPGHEFDLAPHRLEADLVEKLDEVRKRQGLRSRMDLFRKSLQTYLASVGENDVAASLATTNYTN